MNQQKSIRKQAEKLAEKPYYTSINFDKVGDEKLYVAINPELEGCLAQSFSAQDAMDNLEEVRVKYILHLLEHNLPVPEPKHDTSYTIRTAVQGPGLTISKVAFKLNIVVAESQISLPKQEGATIEPPKKFEFA